jgi:(p)ppGpp synthase/HD superfamily hydrolase
MLSIAQTNLQLYNQLRRERRCTADLVRVRAAYELAMPLFSAQFRASGKPFLAHLVGTASLLAWLQQPTTTVIAGLLHAAYEFGDFGDAASGITLARRQRVAGVVGAEAGDLIILYQQTSRATAMRAMREDLATQQSASAANVLLIHLADTVEEYVDGGQQYAPEKARFYDAACRGGVAQETLAGFAALGLQRFIPELAEVFQAASQDAPPAEMIDTRRASFAVLPASAGERLALRWQRRWRKTIAKLSRRCGFPPRERRAA